MIELDSNGVYLLDGEKLIPADAGADLPAPDAARESTIAYQVMRAHSKSSDPKKMRIKFDALMSHRMID